MLSNKEFKKFCKENNGLLNKIRMKYIYLPSNNKEQCEDLEQIMLEGLIKAFKEFNPTRKQAKFQTYAYKVMSSYLLRAYYTNYGRVVKMPYLYGYIRSKVKQCMEAKGYVSDSDIVTIKRKTGATLKMINDAISKYDFQTFNTVELVKAPKNSGRIHEEEEEYIGTNDNDELESIMDRDFDRQRLLSVLNRTLCGEINKRVVTMRYGLDGNEPKSFKEIARIMNRSEKCMMAQCSQAVKSMQKVGYR